MTHYLTLICDNKGIFDLMVQALHEYSTCCHVIPLDNSCIMLELCIIGGEFAICLFKCHQFPFHCCNTILVPKSNLQKCYQYRDISQFDALIRDGGLDLSEILAHMESKGVW
jgi:hypothetical protein